MRGLFSVFLLAGLSLMAAQRELPQTRPPIRMCICDEEIHDFQYHQTRTAIGCLQAFLPDSPSNVVVVGQVNDSIPETLARLFFPHRFVYKQTDTLANEADLVLALTILEKEEDPHPILQKIKESLKPDGIALIITWPKNPTLERVFDHQVSIEKYKNILVSAGFVLLEDIDFFSSLSWNSKERFLRDMNVWFGRNLSPQTLKFAEDCNFRLTFFAGETHCLVVKKTQ